LSGGNEENHEIPQNLSRHVTDVNYNSSRTVSYLWELGSFPQILYILEEIFQFVSSLELHNDLKIPFVQEAIALYATKYKKRTMDHNNELISNLFDQSTNARRLQKTWPEDLAR
jgi:hypothetical protein